jgi:TolB-like protein
LIAGHAGRNEPGEALAAFARCEAALQRVNRTPSTATVMLAQSIRAAAELALPASSFVADGTARSTTRLGVLPLVPLGEADPSLALGLRNTLIAALSGFRWITLVEQASQAPGAEPLEGSKDLDWLLEGTVQKSGHRVRLILRLLDRRLVSEIAWVQRFDHAGGDLLDIQDNLAAEAAAQLDTQLLFLEARRMRQEPRADAYGLLLPAIPSIYQLDRTRYLDAGLALDHATKLAPDFAASHAWRAYWYVFLVGQGWAEDPAGAMRTAPELAQRAVALDPLDGRALALAGHVRGFLHRDLRQAEMLLDRALTLNPYLPIGWIISGLNRSNAGDHAEAIERINRGRQLPPVDPHGVFFDAALMLPALLSRDFARVVELGRRVGELNPRLSTAHKLRLSALGHLGRSEEAAQLRDRLGELEPNFNRHDALKRSPMARAADRDLYVEGLRRAGAG